VIDQACGFARHGWAAVLVGRLVPGVRTLISVPAGVAVCRLAPFLLTPALGTLLWMGPSRRGGLCPCRTLLGRSRVD
jgi:hypothetical protein